MKQSIIIFLETLFPKLDSLKVIKKGIDSIEIRGKIYHDASQEQIQFSELLKIAEFFGTDKVNVDNWSQAGCDTCDHNWILGHNIQVSAIKKHMLHQDELVIKSHKDDY